MTYRRSLFLLVTMLLVVTACSGDSDDAGVATLETTVPDATTSAAPTVEGEQAGLDFAQCMREHGVDMGDPTVDADGNVQLPPIEFSASGEVDPEEAMAEMDATFAECEQHLEGMVLNAANSGSDVEFEDALLAYADCMRDQGVDMPDPDFSSGMIQLGGDTPGDMEEFEAAHEQCREILARVGMDF